MAQFLHEVFAHLSAIVLNESAEIIEPDLLHAMPAKRSRLQHLVFQMGMTAFIEERGLRECRRVIHPDCFLAGYLREEADAMSAVEALLDLTRKGC